MTVGNRGLRWPRTGPETPDWRTLVVKLPEPPLLPASDAEWKGPWSDDHLGTLDPLGVQFPGVHVHPSFATVSLPALLNLVSEAHVHAKDRKRRLVSYFSVECPPSVPTAAVAAYITSSSAANVVYLDPLALEPPGPSTAGIDQTSRDSTMQRAALLKRVLDRLGPRAERAEAAYQRDLDRLPSRAGPLFEGLLAGAKWRQFDRNVIDPAGVAWDGSGVLVVDVEQGWSVNFDGESLHHALQGPPVITPVMAGSGAARSWLFHGHGTAVLSVLRAIVPAATPRVAATWADTPTGPPARNLAGAIIAATAEAAGLSDSRTVILIEAQSRLNGTGPFLPAEVDPRVFEAIALASDLGIVVVEAAGNGQTNLDSVTVPLLPPGLTGPRAPHPFSTGADSGAILVGAAVEWQGGWVRAASSNFGRRVICWGPGENVPAAGDGWLRAQDDWFTTTFGGTSAASAVVAGAAAALLGQMTPAASRGERVARLTALRAKLTSAAANTSTLDPASDRIGVMPNLSRIAP